MFQILDYKEADCLACEKSKLCYLAKCTFGTFAGPICPKCLECEAKKRSKSKNGKISEATLFVEPLQ